MYQYFAFNILFSLLIFLYAYSLKTAPFRIRLRIILLALISWLIPYELIFSLLNQQNFTVFSSNLSEFNGALKQSIASNVNAESRISPFKLFLLFSTVGFLLFVKDFISLKRLLQSYSSKSIPFKKTDSTHIYEVKDSDNVFTVGLFNPKIYIGDKFTECNALPSIIQHELQHIKNKDQIWLLIITFIQKIFWWNPIVLFLSKQARNFIELSCDEMCKENSAESSYQKELAQILLNQHKSSNPLNSSIFGKSQLNIYRIKQLSKEFKMKNTHKAIIFLTAITPFLLVPMVSTSSVSTIKTIYNEKGEKIQLNENQVDLEFSFTIKAPEKNGSTNTRKIESRLIIEYDKLYSFGRNTTIMNPSKLQPINPITFDSEFTINKVDENSVMVNVLMAFNKNGEEIENTPSLWVKNGEEASISINGDGYDIEIIVKPRF